MELHMLATADNCQQNFFFPSTATANILANYEIQNCYEETVHLSIKPKAQSSIYITIQPWAC